MPTSPLPCPQCGTPLTVSDRYCPGCGVDLAVVTLLLEFSAASKKPNKAPPFLPDNVVPRLGEFLLTRGLLTVSQLQQALDYQQAKKKETGQSKMLGEALIELDLISRESLDQAIMAQVLELQAALQASNRQLEERVAERTAELERALKKVNEINQLKSDFVSNISHELRTPLAHIKGYVYLFAEGMMGELNQQELEAMKDTGASVDKLERLIDDLIRFASAARGELLINSGVFCLSDVAQTIINRSDAKSVKANVSLVGNVPDPPI
ncbi:MAG: histidine kinase dimerization/phospho-acceptor domain-containing protein [Chloroflexota bacterium]